MTAFIQHLGHGGGPMSVQKEPHPHMVQISPDNRHLAVSDLGTDKVYTYDFDVNTGSLKPSEQGSVAVEPAAVLATSSSPPTASMPTGSTRWVAA